VARGRALGTIALISSTPGYYSEKDVPFMEELARRAAVAMDNARLYRMQQEVVAARDIFLSVAAHELRTPLTSLQGFAQHLLRRAKREGYMPERDQRSLGVVVTQVGRLNRLIEALLDVSRIQLDQLRLERGLVNLNELVTDLVAEIAPTLEQHTLTLQAAPEPLFVDGDALRLEQVLHNLINNAVKYSLEGGPVTVTLMRDDQWIRLEVQDKGIGIPAADQGQIFQRFGRVPSHATRHIAGMGVGLYLVKEIVTRHGGDVWVDSVEGQGSTFTVRLPLQLGVTG
jgi:signal transduction histidine kinase